MIVTSHATSTTPAFIALWQTIMDASICGAMLAVVVLAMSIPSPTHTTEDAATPKLPILKIIEVPGGSNRKKIGRTESGIVKDLIKYYSCGDFADQLKSWKNVTVVSIGDETENAASSRAAGEMYSTRTENFPNELSIKFCNLSFCRSLVH